MLAVLVHRKWRRSRNAWPTSIGIIIDGKHRESRVAARFRAGRRCSRSELPVKSHVEVLFAEACGMGLGQQAKILTDRQMRTALAYVGENHRDPLRDRVMILLSFKAGLRAKEIAVATWAMVVTADGTVGDVLNRSPLKRRHRRLITTRDGEMMVSVPSHRPA
jgi:integrase